MEEQDRSVPTPPALTLTLWAVLVCAGLGFQLGSRPLVDPDEGRNAEIMREMVVSGDYLIPRLNGLTYLDKPFLFFASGALSMTVLGVTEAAARLPSLLFTLATGLLTAAFAGRSLGHRATWLAGLAAVTAPLALVYSQIVIFDAMLGFWICAALVAMYLAVEAESPSSLRPWSHLAWAAMGLGTLTKGPVAILVPLAAVLPWAVWRHRVSRLWRRGAPVAWLAVVVPWVWVVSRHDPHFLHYAVVTESWVRSTSAELQRTGPVWYYLPYLLVGALPWSLVPIVGWRDLRLAWQQRDAGVMFLLSWLAVPLLLLSLMQSKRPHYVLPLVPALVLLSLWLWEQRPRGDRLPGVRAAAAAWLGIGSILVVAGSRVIPQLPSAHGIDDEVLYGVALALGSACIVGGLAGILASRFAAAALCALSLPSVALLVVSSPLTLAIGTQRSAVGLAATVTDHYPAGIEVVGVEAFPPSLPFYLGRTITLATVDGVALRSNYVVRRYANMVDREVTLRSPGWLASAASDCRTPRVFVVESFRRERRRALQEAGRPWLDTGGSFVLYGPCSPDDERDGPSPAPRDSRRGG